MRILRIALAQINSTVGDLQGNADKILEYTKLAKRRKADIVAFPELAITGYPPEDLILKPQFITDNLDCVIALGGKIRGITAVVGFVDFEKDKGIYNAAAVISEGRIIDVYHKILLPNYGVFDEFRYFRPGRRFPVHRLRDRRFGINICEDIWHGNGPARVQAAGGADVIININASPYEVGKVGKRFALLKERAVENAVAIAYVNAVGGQDELVFDGASMVLSHEGEVIARGRQYEEDLVFADLDLDETERYRKKNRSVKRSGGRAGAQRAEHVSIPASAETARKTLKKAVRQPLLVREEEIYRALVLGTADYVKKNGFKGVVIGLSGGIDSALVATIAVDAIGRENVRTVFMPSQYTSRESSEDAFQLADNLAIEIIEIPIDRIFAEYRKELRMAFMGAGEDATEENLQARIRGNILMAFSNKFGWLVLTTGNKSEMSVGYATLYGDMAGGFAVIKDVPKTLVYDICRWRNEQPGGAVIPERVLWKDPTAELRPDQKDTDTLPPYPVLDPILRAYVEEEKNFEEITADACDRECVKKVVAMVDRSEYKRRQAPPGIKITPRAFGRDRRFPITNRYRSY